ncbi:putative TetR-family transcriptional regulator [Nostocoides japonicum T1-X7]|uniref:Putative TetR-family transcriptional regulator n=1 Tax=Nostocoides japonicum T1-X7 TaxID=1194083 RepID=A0A077LVY0_9MICO|nr:TetR/AcrR family transcriptional regulator [Tetrasphaera japonica]CCH76972.1 putative TetR-family transcriptional regulator [Tetrasphaera japonica T1-X7]
MTRRRLPPAARRAQIIEAARGVIVERGLAVASLRDIAKAADVSLGTVTYHFDGVDEILSAVVVTESERFYEDVVRAADAEPDPWRALEIIVASLFGDSDDVAAHWRIWSDYWAAVARRPEMAAAYADRIRHWEACCTRVIARGVASGTFRGVDPEVTALKLAAYSDGLGTQRAQNVEGLTAEVARTWMNEFARWLLSPDGRPAEAGHCVSREG